MLSLDDWKDTEDEHATTANRHWKDIVRGDAIWARLTPVQRAAERKWHFDKYYRKYQETCIEFVDRGSTDA